MKSLYNMCVIRKVYNERGYASSQYLVNGKDMTKRYASMLAQVYWDKLLKAHKNGRVMWIERKVK